VVCLDKIFYIWSVRFSILPFSIPFSMTFFLCLASLIHFSVTFTHFVSLKGIEDRHGDSELLVSELAIHIWILHGDLQELIIGRSLIWHEIHRILDNKP